MFSHTCTAAVVVMLWASQAVAHMTLATPVPFGTPDNSPLSSSGSNFPCQIVGSADTFYDRSSASNNTMAVGESQTLSFKGSAVHGGGSCQLAVTSEQQPTSSTTWQVILSIEGGCPTVDGNGPSTYDYSIPDSITPGDYVFAWTWVSKESGAPEYYMNCAPITVTAAASSKRSQEESAIAVRDTSALPNLFVANLDSINSCKTTTSTDPLFPDPGPNVSKPSKMTTNYQSPSGTDCFPLGATDTNSTESSSSGSSSSSSSASIASPSTTSSSVSTSAATSVTVTSAASTSSTLPGAVFATSSTSVAVGTITTTETTTPATAAATTATTAAAATTAPASAQASASTNGTSTAGGSSLSGSCTSEGTFNCVGGSEYQQCASGSWTTLQAMPAGTTCQIGESTTLWARDRGESRRMRRVRRNL